MRAIGFKRRLAAFCVAMFGIAAYAAEPWALWTDFTGADAEGGLAPQAASVQNNIDGSAWRFRLAGDASVDPVGALLTGTGAAPTIGFGTTIDVGRMTNGGTPMTVLLAIQTPLENVVDKPLAHIGNGSTGVGMALAALDASAGTAMLRGSWGNGAWGTPRVVANALTGQGVIFVAFSTCLDSSTPSAIGIVEPESGTVAWNALTGLTGSGINTTQIFLGNYANQTSGGLNMRLFGVAVFSGRPTSEDVLVAVNQMPHVTLSEISGNDAWRFEDVEGVTRQEVTVAAASSPSAFTVNNAATDYVIGGAAIGGATSLLKQGTGTLWLKGANTFSGGVTIEGGTVVESGVKTTQNAALGTGKNGSWANPLTLRNGLFDLNGTENYHNPGQANNWGWLSVRTLTLGGQAGTTEIRNGVFGIGTTPAIVYDATNGPGTATISATYNFSGTNGAVERVFQIADSAATETEIDFTGGLHVDNWTDGVATTIVKTGAGTMQLSSRFGFAGLKVTEGAVRMNAEEAFVRGTVTLNGGTLDLNGFNQTLPVLAGTAGAITSSSSAMVTVTGDSTYGGALSGVASLTAKAPVTLSGEVSTTGVLTVSSGGSLTLAGMPAQATIVVDCAAFAGAADGSSVVPLTIPGEIDEARIEWRGLTSFPHLSTTRDPETGAWTLKVERTADNFIVMPMGDSITEGSGNVENAPSYRKALAERMMAAGMNPRFVGARIYKSSPITNEDCRNHTGLSGHRVQTKNNRGGYLQGAPNWLEQAGYPDAVTLMIGTNDYQEPPETVFGQWKALVGTMVDTRPQTWIIVAPIIPPRTGQRNDVLTFAQAYNAKIKSLFDLSETTITVNGEETACVLGTLNAAGRAAFGEEARVIMASMYDAIPVEGNEAYFFDLIHPSQAGYDRMAAVWLEAIKSLAAPEGGLKDAEAIVDAYQTAGAMDTVTVVFNHQQKGTEGVTVTVGGVAAEVSARALSADGRRVTLTLAAPFADGAEVTVGKGALSRTFTARGMAAGSRVTSAQTEGYVAVKALDVPEKGAFNDEAKAKAAFVALEGAEGVVAFDRLGYYVTLARPDGALRWLWVTMDRPVAYATVEALGLPTVNLRTKVSNLRVASNVPGIEPVTEDGVQGLLQFGPNNVMTSAADAEHPVSLGNIYDWNTAFGGTAYGYGAMQVFRLYEEGVGRADSGMPASTLFSYSHWAAGDAGNDEITLGDLANHQGYASGTQGASLTSIFTTGFPTLNTTAYSVRRIEIWVRPTAVRTWAGATEGTWDKAEASVWTEGAPFADGNEVTFGALADGATSATVTVGEAVAPSSLAVTQNAYTFSGGSVSANTLSVATDASATFSGESVSVNTLSVAADASATFEATLSTMGATAVDGTLAVRAATFGQTPTGTGTFVKMGTDDLTLTLSSANVLPTYEVRGGKLTLSKPSAGNGAAFAGGRAPSFKVASGAHLVWDSNDLVGWERANTVTVAEISGILEKTRDANETFSGRLLLKDGGELRNGAANKFLLWKSAIVEVEASARASITGAAIQGANGTPELRVGEGAELAISAPLSIPGGITLKKGGPGKAILSGTVSGSGSGWGTLDVAEGTLKTSLSGNLDATLTVQAGATLEMAGDLGKGGLPATVNGRLVGHGKLFGSNGNGSIALGATAKVAAPLSAGETLELAPGNGQAVTVAPGATFVAGEGSLLLTNGYARGGEGTFVVALPEGVTLARGEALPVLTVGEGNALDAADFAAPQGLTCYAEGRTLFVANLLAVDPPEGAAEAWSSATLKAATAAVNALGEAGASVTRVTKVEVSTRGGASVIADVATVNDVLTCFQGGAVATVNSDDPTAATVTVRYEFGVAGVVYERSSETVSVTVRVQGAETAPAAFANGVSLEFFAAEGEGETLATGATLPGAAEATVRLPDFPEWLTRPFKVRAVVR